MKRSVLYLAILSLAVDLLAVFVGLVWAYNLRSGGEDLYFWPFETYFRYVLLTLPIWLVLFASVGLYNARILPRGWNALGRLLLGLVAGWGVLLIGLYLWRSPAALVFPRLVIIYGILLTTALTIGGRVILGGIINALHHSGLAVIRTAVVATNGAADALIRQIEHNLSHGRTVVATFPPDEAVAKLSALHKTEPIDEIIVSDANIPETKVMEILNWAEDVGANFALLPSLLSIRATNVEVGVVGSAPLMFFKRTPLEGWQRVYKRIFDLLLVIPALIILSPILLILALLVRLTSPGPAIYKQARVGQDGRVFYVHKFRSMYVDGNERFKMTWSADENTDPRITPIGRILRRTNLDELPQLWDILRGAMSIVGPRPEQPKYVEKFAEEVPGYLKRHHVKTGLTGWAQINGLRGDTSIAERIKYDLFYIENWSIWFDLRIILSTVVLVFRQALGGRG